MNENNRNEMNMINQLIPCYPKDRHFGQMGGAENSLNLVIKTALGIPNVDIKRFRELREIVDEIGDEMVDGVDRWNLYSAMIIHYMFGNPDWKYSRCEISRFISPEVARLAYDNEMTRLMYTFAETLVEIRDKAYYKRTGSIWWGRKAGGTAEECEARFRALADEVETYLAGTELLHEYIMLTDRIFEDSHAQWKFLREKGFNDLEDVLASIPDRTILHRGRACTIIDVKKSREYAGREVIDDIEFDMYETCVKFILRLNQCGTGEIYELNVRDWHSGLSCLEIFRRYEISIPDEYSRKIAKLL